MRDETKSGAETGPAAFPDEAAHLIKIEAQLAEARKEAEESVQALDEEYREAVEYMAKHRADTDAREIFQNERALGQLDMVGSLAVEFRDRLNRLADSPYFARIDFCEPSDEAPAAYYIGRFSFLRHEQVLITDWRSPVASMFYDYEVGPAGFSAPAGRVEGELIKKRQFKIKGGKMEFAFESSVNIQDDVLQRELSHTSDEKMKSIISTIQKEQNVIIRNEKAYVMIIQGVAGSGKTSIALHRLAYLLYRFKKKLTAKNVTIISPNKVFGDYISNVLPELGEEPVYGVGFEEIARMQLQGIICFEAVKNPLETRGTDYAERARFKSTLEFKLLMDDFLAKMPNEVFEPADLIFENFSVDADWIAARYGAYHKYAVKRRLVMMADDIYDRFATQNIRKYKLPKPIDIIRRLTKMLKVRDPAYLYREFYKKTRRADMYFIPYKDTLEWPDVYPFMYLLAAFEGLKESTQIRHLVIDEMQDYTPTQYAVINILFDCQKTILGDYGQSVSPDCLATLDDLRSLYPGSEFVRLNKSYRSTCEIIKFASRVQAVESLEAVERHGAEPDVVRCRDAAEELDVIRKKIEDFKKGEYATLGVILRTNAEAKAYHEKISAFCEAELITPESTSFKNGISVASVQMSKGLEFDAVIIPAADINNYFSKHDRSLLYIACTRAMHSLSLTYTGTITPLIGGVKA